MTEPVTLIDFVRESNQIENIHGDPTRYEVHAHERFLEADEITVQVLEEFVSAVTLPTAILRRKVGLNVRVGSHIPPPGGPQIETDLNLLLAYTRNRPVIEETGTNEPTVTKIRIEQMTPYEMHLAYENLHPFTDGNGRSGRVLWLWMMGGVVTPKLFLHEFYYQTLEGSGFESPPNIVRLHDETNN